MKQISTFLKQPASKIVAMSVKVHTMEEYEAYCRSFRKREPDPNMLPSSFEEWSQGYDNGRYYPPGRCDGLQGREGIYSWESWMALGAPWSAKAEEAYGLLQGSVMRGAYVWSASAGTGKTGFGVACLRRLAAEKRLLCAVVRCPDVNQRAFAELFQMQRSLEKYHAVLLDDVNRLKLSSAAIVDFWHGLTDMLMRNDRITICTSNASLEALTSASSSDCVPAFDRLREGGLQIIEATGASLRA